MASEGGCGCTVCALKNGLYHEVEGFLKFTWVKPGASVPYLTVYILTAAHLLLLPTCCRPGLQRWPDIDRFHRQPENQHCNWERARWVQNCRYSTGLFLSPSMASPIIITAAPQLHCYTRADPWAAQTAVWKQLCTRHLPLGVCSLFLSGLLGSKTNLFCDDTERHFSLVVYHLLTWVDCCGDESSTQGRTRVSKHTVNPNTMNWSICFFQLFKIHMGCVHTWGMCVGF